MRVRKADHNDRTCTVFYLSNTGIVGSNPIRGMDVYLRQFYVYVALCRQGSCEGSVLIQSAQAYVYNHVSINRKRETLDPTGVPCDTKAEDISIKMQK